MDSLSDYQNKQYEDFWSGKHMELLKKQENDIVSHFLKPSTGWFLEAGCGYGRFYQSYTDLFENKIMLDYAIENLIRFKQKFDESNLYFVAADARAMPFRESAFETIVSIRLIQNLPKPETLVSEFSRLMKPQAQLVMSYFNRRSLLRLFKYGIKCLDITHIEEHKASFGLMCGSHPQYIKRLLQKNDLSIQGIRGSGFSYQLSNSSNILQKMIQNSRLFRYSFNTTSRFMDSVLGSFSYSLWQFLNIFKDSGNDIGKNNNSKVFNFNDLLQCPLCANQNFDFTHKFVKCLHCEKSYPIIDGIYDFRVPVT